MPERVGLKVLPISTKSRFLLRERTETVGEEQEPPCMYAGEASVPCVRNRHTLRSIVGIPQSIHVLNCAQDSIEKS